MHDASTPTGNTNRSVRLFSWMLNVCYVCFLILVSPVILYRVFVLKKYREGWDAKLFGRVPELPPIRNHESETGSSFSKNDGIPVPRRIWLHAVSVGEVNLLRPLLRQIDEKHPEWECVVSSTSSTGYALAKTLYGEKRTVFFAPLDFSGAVNNAVRRIKPDLLVLAEQEIWPNLLAICRSRQIPVALINGRFGENGYRRLRMIRFLWRFVMRQISLFCVQSDLYAEWFRRVGAVPESVHTTGSMKFDNAQTDRKNPATQKLAALAGISTDETVFLAGSTQEPEEELAVETYLALHDRFPKLRLIIVPRHPERFDAVADMLTRRLGSSPTYWYRRSELHDIALDIARNGGETQKAVPLLVDTVGELGWWWGTAHIAFVGGSMGARGGQNMLEPAAYGAAVGFGPKTGNFRDIVELLLADQAAVVVQNGDDLTSFVRRCLEESEYADRLGERAKSLVSQHQGATKKTVTLLEQLL